MGLANEALFLPFFRTEFIPWAGDASLPDADFKKYNMPPLNTILYGPPGTGKTYHTVTRAAEIIAEASFIGRYDEARTLYLEQLGLQAEFVTFHQNYSYEDFVAGLRPDTDVENSQLRFKEHKGIFYRICQRAKENWQLYRQYVQGEKYEMATFEEALDEFLEPLLENEDPIELETSVRNVPFKIYSSNDKNLGFEKQSGSKDHTLSLSTMKAIYEGKRQYGSEGLGVYYNPVVEKLKAIANKNKKEIKATTLLNYVLIIDEINRANISRVFGELITLLEKDKRLGAKNELRLRLPGLPESELFGVPPNLYIVGTLNTADKSIGLIDIALRRRFSFEDMYPRPELVDQLLPKPYSDFLNRLNEKIREQKGADFMIGQSYFLPEEGEALDIVQVLNNKVIPLLNEYFYNLRGNMVSNLLSPLKDLLPGITFVEDSFIGIRAKSNSVDNH
jgi:5-methylcytosine-specific restriction endonuclease McrBC GTP-binding regulatory subunit McrB